MFFNSYAFVFLFLPIVVLGFFQIARNSHRLAALWLVVASLFFYGWWNSQFVLLLLISISFNYTMGHAIGHARVSVAQANRASQFLAISIIFNLLLLFYFKYANFFIDTARQLTGVQWINFDIVLPLGISFFTFTQIAFLVDVRRGIAREYNFIHYALFVSYFPHLIAGPILHHKQVMPQFGQAQTYRPCIDSISIGITLFGIGLFKKVMLADHFALYADPIFDATAKGGQPMLLEAWTGVLMYTLQLYFDFSGYSDMAIGMSKIINVNLPFNFNSPYKASSIIEFWNRWHMTLSNFLRDYVFIPLIRLQTGMPHYTILFITMLLVGLWHGAGWTYVLWGGLNGLYLVINHSWRRLVRHHKRPSGRFSQAASILLTFTLVAGSAVPFRAADFETILRMFSAMSGVHGVALPARFAPYLEQFMGSFVAFIGAMPLTQLSPHKAGLWLTTGLMIVWFLPNSQQWMGIAKPTDNGRFSRKWINWQPTKATAIAIGTFLGITLLAMGKVSPFLYFQF